MNLLQHRQTSALEGYSSTVHVVVRSKLRWWSVIQLLWRQLRVDVVLDCENAPGQSRTASFVATEPRT